MSGQCVTTQDGYYYVSAICVGLGVLSLVLYIIPTARRLEGELYLMSLVLLVTDVPLQHYRCQNGG